MSYTNPQQIVDTQSAQHLANLQQTITGTFANVAANYAAQKKQEQAEIKKRQEENAKIIKANQDEEDLIMYDLEKYKADNPELNISGALTPMIDRYSEIKDKLDLGTITDPKEQAALRMELVKIRTLVPQLKSNIASLSEMYTTYQETYKKSGSQGGLDATQTDSKMLDVLNIFFNNTSGKRDVEVNVDENGNLSADFVMQQTDKDGKFIGDPKTLPSRFLRDLLAGKAQNPIVTIPDKTIALNNLDKKILIKDINGKAIVPGNFLTTEYRKNGNVMEEVKVVNNKAIEGQFGAELDSDIDSMKPVEFVAYYNNILNPSKQIKISDVNDEMRQVGKKLYKEKYLQRYRKYEEVISRKPIDSVVKPKTDYSDVTDVVNSITQGNYDALANYGNISSIGKVQRPQKKGENKIKVLYNVGTSGLGEADYNLKDRTSLAALAAKIFVGSSQDNTERRKEFVNQMISNSNIGTKSNPLSYTP